MLGVDKETGIFICDGCDEEWSPEEVSGVLWNSASVGMHEITHRLMDVEELLAAHLDIQRCVGCGEWHPTKDMVDMVSWYACPQHVGDAIGDLLNDPEPLIAAVDWLETAATHQRPELSERALWERIAAASPLLAQAVEDEDDVSAVRREVKLPKKAAAALNLPVSVPLGLLARRVADLVDADVPTNRAAMGFLIVLVDTAFSMAKQGYTRETLESALEESYPLSDRLRVEVAVDLCMQSMENGTVFSGDMALEALGMLSDRALEQLLILFGAKDRTNV